MRADHGRPAPAGASCRGRAPAPPRRRPATPVPDSTIRWPARAHRRCRTTVPYLAPIARKMRRYSTRAGGQRKLAACSRTAGGRRPRRCPAPPGRRAAGPMTWRSALRVLRRLARLLQTVLLALGGTRVARQEAGTLERGAVLRGDLDEGTRDGQTQGACLARGATADQAGVDVEGLGPLDGHQRRLDQLLVH